MNDPRRGPQAPLGDQLCQGFTRAGWAAPHRCLLPGHTHRTRRGLTHARSPIPYLVRSAAWGFGDSRPPRSWYEIVRGVPPHRLVQVVAPNEQRLMPIRECCPKDVFITDKGMVILLEPPREW